MTVDPRFSPTLPEDGEAATAPGRGASIGRFTVLGHLGSGGMGVVLSAYDPHLDRKVALKIIRGGGSGSIAVNRRDALVREAQAMARLAHPNVVAVHEIAFVDEAAYLVMEQVDGRTLRAWLAEEDRGWEAKLAVLLAAGAGLAAAHRAGIIHRDFKPENVLVGEDERPRVSDFGLASFDTIDERATIAGTRGYMAPEQASGGAVDARSDQYSFCITAWEALHGERPPEGAAPPRERRAPPWLYRILARGLAPRPEDRWPSMDALLAALRPRPSRRRVVVATLAGAVAVGGLAFAVGRQGATPSPCGGSAALVAPLWADAPRARVEAAFAGTGRAYAADTFRRVDEAMATRLRAWAAAHQDACEATHVRHEQSDTLLDLRMSCLGRARSEIGALVALLEQADGATLDRAAQAAAAAGDLELCSDTAQLAAVLPPPRDPALARQVEAVREEIARVEALRKLGKLKEGVVAARAVLERARPLGHAPILAVALYTAGALELLAGDMDTAVDRLYAAARAGAEARDDEVVAQAMNELVFALGSRKQRFEAAETAFQLAAAATARAGNSPRLLAQLYGHRAQALFRKGEYAMALPLRTVALGLVAQVHGPRSYEVAMQLNYTAATLDMLGRSAEARATYERSVAVGRDAVGSFHPRLGSLLNNYAINRMNAFDFDAAATVLEEVVELQRQVYADDDPTLAEAVHNLGTARFYQRRLRESRELVERALRSRQLKLAADHPKIAESHEVLGNIDLLEGRLVEAHEQLQKTIAMQHKAYGAAHPKLAGPYRGVAEVMLAMGRLREARAAAEAAVEIDRKTIGEENPQFGLSLTSVADVTLAEGRPQQALPVYLRALALLEKEYGPDSVGVVFALLGVCDARVDAGDAGARDACARALAVARKAPAEIALRAQLSMARADWAVPGARAAALASAREARSKQAALPYGKTGLARFDRWLASRRAP